MTPYDWAMEPEQVDLSPLVEPRLGLFLLVTFAASIVVGVIAVVVSHILGWPS